MQHLRMLLPPFCLLLAALGAPMAAHGQVLWEDYQGTNDVLGTINQDKPGPNYNNNSASSAINLDLLRTISSNVTNATRTGSSATIDFRATSGTLCNTSNSTAGTGYDGAGTSATCQADAQGRVLFALVKFPQSGSYTFAVAHDDEVDLDLSADFSNTNYKTAAYNLPVGTAAGYTAGETTYENLAGVFSSPTANACILLRLYWNNAGGLNFLRLRWTRPDSVVEIVPAAQLFDPGLAASSAGCTGSITGSATSVVVNKVVGASGRAGAADQFTVSLKDNAETTVLSTATTSGSGTGQQASTGATVISTGTTYKITDVMASGSGYAIGAYTPTIACTRAGLAYTPGGAAPTWTVTATTAGQQINCNITNSRRSATLQLRKTWVNAKLNDAITLPASTGFNINTVAFTSIANTANETDTGTAVSVLVGDNGTLLGENFTTGAPSSYASFLNCSGGTLSGSNAQANNSLLITTAAAGTTIVCTYTNTYRPPLIVTKSSTLFSDPIHGTSNPKMIPGALVDYLISVTSPSAYNVDSGSLFVIDNLPPEVWLQVTDLGGANSGPVIFTDGSPVTNLTYGFTNLNSAVDDLEFSQDGGLTWGYFPAANLGTVDTRVTGIRVNPKGSMAASRTFTLRFRSMIR